MLSKMNYMKLSLFLIFAIMLTMLILPNILGLIIKEIIVSDKEMMVYPEPVAANELEILIENTSNKKIESLMITVGDNRLVFYSINIGDFRKSLLDYSGECDILIDVKYDDQTLFSETLSLLTPEDNTFKVLRILVYDNSIRQGGR